MTEKREMYLKPDEFFKEVLRCRINDDKVSEKLGHMFMLLAEKTTTHYYWIRYDHLKPDLISESLIACMKAFKGFRPLQKWYTEEHGDWDGKTLVDYNYATCYNPHAWFTTAIFNRLKGFMKSEYNQVNIFNKAKAEVGLDVSFAYEDLVKAEEQEDNGMSDDTGFNQDYEPDYSEDSEFEINEQDLNNIEQETKNLFGFDE